MARKAIWSKLALQDKFDIFEYWNSRNQSQTYSRKLNVLFNENIKIICDFPKIGRKSEYDNVRLISVHEYSIFYEIMNNSINILTIWDNRQDKEKLKQRFL